MTYDAKTITSFKQLRGVLLPKRSVMCTLLQI